ncbi:DUF317 domain-containing protein [Streptomyces seoulensis]|uniref:DUF317 domain-containing protein n=1 Tax=Streptomyces seoulensis TaxID=73044 RepID=UPI001FCBA2BD|nr:DUF317 domain-containing protein [Streptomyces seoulensis]BDH07226.1 hypothetical protein HEK131_44530 [Streptomyces seoulensis]
MAFPETVEVDFIAPRHLAGGGDPAWVTVPLHRASGWSHGDDSLLARVLPSSPDQKSLLRLEPDADGQGWTLSHAAEPDRPAWYASFGAHTPVELIAAVTDTLTAPTPNPAASCDPYETLRQFAWSPPTIGGEGLVSPHGTAYVQRLGSAENPGAWFAEATLDPDRRPIWQAHFDEHTPPHLVAAFTAALADPKPLWRPSSRRGVPARAERVVTRRSIDVRTSLVAAALEIRVQSLAARRSSSPAGPIPQLRPAARDPRSR